MKSDDKTKTVTFRVHEISVSEMGKLRQKYHITVFFDLKDKSSRLVFHDDVEFREFMLTSE